MIHSLKQDSFWAPYLDVMNTSDLTYTWTEEELRSLHDFEVVYQARSYQSDLDSEWKEISKLVSLYPERLQGVTRELFERMYNFACTRCFGWTLPSTMMVPLADFLNHYPSDT